MDTYEKKYKEIVGLIKKAYLYAQTDSTKAVLEEIFPELAESEDERIRKAIHIYLDWLDGRNKDYQPKGDYSIKDMITWLEKQGEKQQKTSIWKHWKDGIAGNGEGEPIYLIKYGRTYSLSSCLGFECDYIELSELDKLLSEKQGEQKPADKVEPKFKVGDFIVNDYCMGKVIELTGDAYLLDTGQGIPFSCEHNAHFWTIQDAKDGDVLALKNDTTHTLICMSPTTCDTGSYCRLRNGYFIKNKEYGWASALLTPATKEQRDLLFQKMHEAGCLWDSESRQLLSLKAEPSGEQKPAWSEEDEKQLNDISKGTMAKKTTIKISHKDGNTVVSNDNVEWDFGYKMLDETVIASLVFQTVFMRFKKLTMLSSDFTIDFTMEDKINQ